MNTDMEVMLICEARRFKVNLLFGPVSRYLGLFLKVTWQVNLQVTFFR